MPCGALTRASGQAPDEWNWLKRYEKAGWILRVEMWINDPEEFRLRRRVLRRGRRRTEWVPLRRSAACLLRYREASLQSNAGYVNAFARIEDPTVGLRGLDAIHHAQTPRSWSDAEGLQSGRPSRLPAIHRPHER